MLPLPRGPEDVTGSRVRDSMRRRGLLRLGTIAAAVTSATVLNAGAAKAAPGDKTQPNAYVPLAEKGAPMGVATLDGNGRVPSGMLPDLSALSQGVSVRSYGAKGDGVTDDAPAISAAIAAAGANGAVYFPRTDAFFKINSPITIGTPGIRIHGDRGTKVKAGATRTFVVTARDVTIEGITVERDVAQPNAADTINLRANVSVGATGFISRNVDYINANMNCLYLANGACNGATISGGSMQNSSVRRNASGVYVAPGGKGNNKIVIDGVKVTGAGAPDGILVYDASDSTVRNCVVEHMRKIPTAELTGWRHVSGTVYRAPDRADNSTMIVRADGVQLADQVDTTNPGLNAWGLNGGYVYVNVGADPTTKRIESDMPGGYGIMFYFTESGYSGMNRNLVQSNRVTDTDGIGIYMQFQNSPTICRNNSTANNILKDVCLAGIQHTSLAFAGIGWGGGYDCVSTGDQIHSAGSPGKPAPGVRVQNQSSGRLIGVAAYGCSGDGISVASANWALEGCITNGNAVSGIRVFSGGNGNAWRGIQIVGCQSSENALRGVDVEVVTSGSTVQASVIGGVFFGNGQQAVNILGATDSKVVGGSFHNNGGGTFYAIRLGGTTARSIVSDVSITGTVTNMKGVEVAASTTDCAIGRVMFNSGGLGTPVPLSLGKPVQDAGALGYAPSYIGNGAPEHQVVATVGAQYRRLDGGAGTSFYVKETGAGNTGWVAK